MLIQPLLQQLHELRLTGMAAALEQQLATGDDSPLPVPPLALLVFRRS